LVCKTGPKCSYRNTNLIYKCRSPDRLTFLQEHSTLGVGGTRLRVFLKEHFDQRTNCLLGEVSRSVQWLNVPGGTSALIIVCASLGRNVPAGTLVRSAECSCRNTYDGGHFSSSVAFFFTFGE
jgi:hypothetical protein